jgi:hypothetical protein
VSAAGVAFTVNDSALVAMGTGASDCGTIQVPEVARRPGSAISPGRDAGCPRRSDLRDPIRTSTTR